MAVVGCISARPSASPSAWANRAGSTVPEKDDGGENLGALPSTFGGRNASTAARAALSAPTADGNDVNAPAARAAVAAPAAVAALAAVAAADLDAERLGVRSGLGERPDFGFGRSLGLTWIRLVSAGASVRRGRAMPPSVGTPS